MTQLRPFFSYYGAKYTGAKHYGPPRRDLVIEPFAGSACYSTRWAVPRVRLYDVSPDICDLWDFLIRSSERDIASIPDAFEHDDEFLSLPRAPRLLCAFWVSKGRAEAIKSRGAWMTGAIDPASRGRTQDEGKRLIDQYEAYGLNVVPAINAVLPGLDHIWSLLSLGRLKFFRHLSNTADEYRFYRREIKEDKLGVSRAIVVKSNDHLMDALRYAIMTWDRIAKVKPAGERVGQSHRVADSKAGY
ncbi:MAG: hypothetical protein KDK24_10060 [Pseudooceanicola sp.]|nr:hypothetical protein [Pseudooceanicola sp.]